MSIARFLAVLTILALLPGTALAAAVTGGAQLNSPARVAQTIKLAMPNGGTLELGKEAAVAWTYSGYPDTATVRLSLIKDGTEVGEIADKVPIKYATSPSGTGAMPGKWKIGSYLGGSVDPGSGYKIRVRVNGFSGQDESDSAFTIVPAGPPPTLKLTAPVGGEKWEQGKPVKITWDSFGLTGQLRIVLTKGGIDKGTIGRQDATAGFFEWEAGKLLPPDNMKILDAGNDYRIRIENLARTLSDESKTMFSLSGPAITVIPLSEKPKIDLATEALLTPKTIKVISPAAGTTLNRLGEFDIYWQYSGNLKGSYVKLTLFKAGTEPGPGSYSIIEKWSVNSGKFHWNLPGPEGFELGSYKIRVQSLKYPEVYGDSDIITFTAKEHSVTAGYDAKTSNHEKVYIRDHQAVVVKWDVGSLPDLGPGNIRVGFRNKSHDDAQISYVYRSFISFDLGNLKGKVKWAKLSYVKNDGTPDGNRPLFALSLPWNGSASDLFSIAGTPVNPLDPAEMAALVQKWIDDPNMNFGLVMIGPDESMANNNAGFIMVLSNVRLEIGLSVVD